MSYPIFLSLGPTYQLEIDVFNPPDSTPSLLHSTTLIPPLLSQRYINQELEREKEKEEKKGFKPRSRPPSQGRKMNPIIPISIP
jgi:hypothetical protein